MNNEFSELSQESKIRFAKYNQNFESLYSLFKDKDSNDELKTIIMNNKHFNNIYNSKIKYIDLVKSSTNEDELLSYVSINDIDVKNEIYNNKFCPAYLKMILFTQVKSKDEQLMFLKFASNENIKQIVSNTIYKEVLEYIIDNPNKDKFDDSIKDMAKKNKFYTSSSLVEEDESIEEESIEIKPKISIESDILNFIKSSQPKPILESKKDIKINIVEEVNESNTIENEVVDNKDIIEEELPVLKKIELTEEFINMLDEQKTNTLVELPFKKYPKPLKVIEEDKIIESNINIEEPIIKETIIEPIIVESKKEEVKDLINDNVEKLRLTTNISDLIFNSSTKILDEKIAIVNNPICPLNILEKFSIDPNLMVKSGIAWNPNVSINILNDFLNIEDIGFLLTLVSSPQMPKPLIRKLSNSDNPTLKEFVIQKLNSF